MEKADLPFLSVVELSRLLEAREVSPVELTEAYLERIEEVNPRLNAYITVASDEAMQRARLAETEIGKGNYIGPLHGIPVAVKDQMWTRGIRTTNASTLLADFVPEEDATAVARLKEAGAILLGKLNMSEFASGGRFRLPYGIPRNPWNTDYEPGSSSSGSGAATAASLCATSLGEDTSGSIRHPSSWSGVVGLRPTWGRVSRYGLFPIIWSMDQAGPMSRSVEDCAITL
ncbi:MAG: amidase, partial [Dehalococcoidia bacterium]